MHFLDTLQYSLILCLWKHCEVENVAPFSKCRNWGLRRTNELVLGYLGHQCWARIRSFISLPPKFIIFRFLIIVNGKLDMILLKICSSPGPMTNKSSGANWEVARRSKMWCWNVYACRQQKVLGDVTRLKVRHCIFTMDPGSPEGCTHILSL